MSDDRAAPTRSAITPPPPITTTLTWHRTTKLPPEDDKRTFVLQLADGSYMLGKRRSLHRVQRPTGVEFVKNSVSGALPGVITAFVDVHTGSQPIDGVTRWAALEEPSA